MNRRDLLKALAALAIFGLQDDEELVDFADLRGFKTELRESTPRVRFFDLRRLTSWLTPEEEFYSFHQTDTVRADANRWRLRVSGFVDQPREFTLDQLKQRPDKREETVTLECSGNAPGPGANGQVSNGTWAGVGLASILRDCGVRPEAREAVFFGMDIEHLRNPDFDTPHGRSIYIQDALTLEPMLAFTLNGKPLPAEHGFPVRLILPGWYGMAQIKWLSRIDILDRRYEGTHMSRNYHTMNIVELPNEALWLETSISKTRLKSVVARVTRRRQSGGRFAYRIAGAAWGGPSPIRTVEVKIDNGPWRAADFTKRGGTYGWSLWSIDWKDATAGEHILVSRAIDTQGRIQPTSEERGAAIKTARENNAQWPRPIFIVEDRR